MDFKFQSLLLICQLNMISVIEKNLHIFGEI